MDAKLKHVAFLTSALIVGGAETQLVRVACGLKRRGWRVEVLSMIEPSHFLDELADAEIPVETLNMEKGKASLSAAAKAVGIFKRWSPEALVTFNFPADTLGRFAAVAARIPVVVASFRTSSMKSKRREWMYRYTDSLVTLTAPNSERGADLLASGRMVKRSKLKVMPNGFDVHALVSRPLPNREAIRASLSIPDGAFVWLAVGNLLECKNYPKLLRAMRILKDSVGPSVQLRVAGASRPPLELAAMTELTVELGVDDVVTFLGVRSDVLDLMAAADGFVLTSDHEGTPNAVLEAMASGLPIVSTNVGDVSRMLENGVSGFVVPPTTDDVVAEAMSSVMKMSAVELRAMGGKARDYVFEHHEIERVVDRWEEMVTDLIENRHSKT